MPKSYEYSNVSGETEVAQFFMRRHVETTGTWKTVAKHNICLVLLKLKVSFLK